MAKPLLIVGGYGSGEIAASTFKAANEQTGEWDILGFLSDVKEPGERIGEFPIIGSTDEISDKVGAGIHIHYTLHFNAQKKEERVRKLQQLGLPEECFASAVHPLAYLNPATVTGHNYLLLPFSATSVGSVLGSFTHVYTGGFLGHDCKVGDYATVAAQSIVGGRVNVGEGAHIGLNASILEDVQVGEYSVIGMGSVVIRDTAPRTIHAGNPARYLRDV